MKRRIHFIIAITILQHFSLCLAVERTEINNALPINEQHRQEIHQMMLERQKQIKAELEAILRQKRAIELKEKTEKLKM